MSFLVCFHLPAQPLALELMHFLVVTGTKNPLTLKGRNCNCWPRNHFTFTSIKHCTRNDPSCETSVNWTTSPGSCVVALGSEGWEDDSIHASRSHETITHCTALLQGQGQACHASATFFSVTTSYRFFQEPWYIGWLLFLSLLFITFYFNCSPFASSSPWGWRVPLCQTCSNKDVAGLLTAYTAVLL